jgi:hypothetical protein
MEVSPIHNTDYFLLFVTSGLGVKRYIQGTFEKFALLKVISSFKNDRFARGIHHVEGSSYGLASVFEVDKVVSFDATQMKKVSTMEVQSGKMEELTVDRTQTAVASAGNEALTIF